MSRYRFIRAEQGHYPIALLCRTVGVSRSGYYAWRSRPPSARAQADAVLLGEIRRLYQRSRQTYGAPRVQAALAQQQQRVGRKRVARLMRAAGLVGCGPRRRRLLGTTSDGLAAPAPNLVARQFARPAPDQLWLGDLTYIPTAEGWLYLALLVDGCSRRVVGWAMADHLRTELPLAALQMALDRRQPPPGLIHHSDRGSQYTAHRYQAVLAAQAITPSMSRPATCYDNALAESVFATLKRELVDRQVWPSRARARQAIFEYLEVFYNRQRLHSALGYRSPVDYEALLAATPAA